MKDHDNHATYTSYVTGFVLSIILTLAAYIAVVNHLLPHTLLIFAIVELAAVQLLVQLILFLHLGQESKPKWNLIAFLFASLVVTILVAGSIWIMNSLNYNMHRMTPQQTNDYMMHEEGIQR